MWYIGTKQECIDYNNLVILGENYKGDTNTWSEIVDHPDIEDLSAVQVNYSYDSDMETIEDIITEWFSGMLFR